MSEFNDYSDFRRFFIDSQTVEHGPVKLECTPDNTTLYLHHPDRFPMYDHFFVNLPEELVSEEYRGRNVGAFVTRHIIGEEEFERIANAVSASCNYPVVYRPEPTDSDRRQVDEQMEAIFSREIEDIEPEDFL